MSDQQLQSRVRINEELKEAPDYLAQRYWRCFSSGANVARKVPQAPAEI